MLPLEKSKLYNYLVFLRKYNSGFNVKEVFNLILGYQLASDEEWISEFISFIDKRLILKYYNGELDKLPEDFGRIIFKNQKSDADGVREFFDVLNDFIRKNEYN